MTAMAEKERYGVRLREGLREKAAAEYDDRDAALTYAHRTREKTGNTFWVYDRASKKVVFVAPGTVNLKS